MNCYLAPLEGITGYIYRNAYHENFHPMQKYFTPFLAPNKNNCLKAREINDILPKNNQGLPVIPQILTNQAEHFLWAAQELEQFGYEELNLNLGCPAKTVVTKGKGCGMLADQERLDRFLEQIFSFCKLKISIKTRIGLEHPGEMLNLIEIFNKYPLEELIIHPRIQADYYNNKPNHEMFAYASECSIHPVVYNGDLFSAAALKDFHEKFPSVHTVMIGRGILRNPGLIKEYSENTLINKKQLKDFHDQIYHGYQKIMSGERNVLFRMKELWSYMIILFHSPDKYLKKIKKAEKQKQYDAVIKRLFEEQDFVH